MFCSFALRSTAKQCSQECYSMTHWRWNCPCWTRGLPLNAVDELNRLQIAEMRCFPEVYSLEGTGTSWCTCIPYFVLPLCSLVATSDLLVATCLCWAFLQPRTFSYSFQMSRSAPQPGSGRDALSFQVGFVQGCWGLLQDGVRLVHLFHWGIFLEPTLALLNEKQVQMHIRLLASGRVMTRSSYW